VTGLTAGTAYCFEVEAGDASGYGSPSALTDVFTLPGTPGAPSETGATTSTIVLTWSAVTNATSYTLLYVAYTGSCGVESVWSTGMSSPQTVTGLNTGSAYCFELEAVDGSGTGSAGPALSAAATLTSAPTGLTVGTVGSTTVQLSWTAPTTSPASGVVTSYTVESAIYTGSVCLAYGGPETFASGSTYTGLTAGTAYCFEVAAVDAGGTSAYSTAVTNTFTLPGVVTGLASGTYTVIGLTLTWTNPTNTTNDRVLQAVSYGGSSCGGYSVIYTAGSVVTSYPVTGLTAGTAYCFEVEAADSAGWGASSALTDVFTLPATALSLTPGSYTTTGITLTWTNPTNATTDKVLQAVSYGGATCGGYSTIDTSVSPITSYPVTGLTAGTGYCFEVQVGDPSGYGPPSVVYGAMTLAGPVTGLASGSYTTTSITLTWTNPTNTTVDEVLAARSYGGSSCGGYNPIQSGTLITSYPVSGLAAGSAWCLEVETNDGTGYASPSALTDVFTLPAAPGAPSQSTTTTSSIVLTWSAVTNATSYVILDASYTGSCGSYSTVASGQSEPYTVGSLSTGTAYCFEIKATDPSGTGAAGSALSAAATLTAAPTSLAAGTATTTTIVLTWTAPATSPASGVVTSYTVQRAVWYSGTTCGAYGNGETVASGGTYTGLTAGTAYCFQVAAVDSGGTSAYSTAITDALTLPSTVTGLGSGTYTTTGLTLTWTNPTNTTIDNVLQAVSYGGSSCGGYSSVQSGTLIATYAVTGLTAGTAYCFEVEAGDASGYGSPSALTHVLTLPAAPGAPSQGTTTVSSITLTWGSVTNATSYVILDAAYTGSCGSYSQAASGVTSPHSVGSLSTGTAYCFEIKATDASGTGSAGSALSAAATLTAAPTSLASGASTATTIVLTWTAPSQTPSGIVTSYTVQMATYSVSCSAYGSPETVASGGSYTGLTAGDYYCFEVAAVDSGGTSAYSTAITGVLVGVPPLAPTHPAATPTFDTNSVVALNWTLQGGTAAVNMTLWRSTGASCVVGGATFTNLIGSVTTYSVSGLSAGTQYSWEIQAWNTTGEGAWSSCFSATTYAAPGAPSSLAATATGLTTVGLTWSAASGTLVNNTVEYGTSCGTYTVQISVGVVTAYTVTGLAPYTSFCFVVEAWSAYSHGSLSGTATATTETSAPYAPTLFNETSIGATSVAFGWTNPSTASGSLVNGTLLWGASCGAVSGGGIGTWTHGTSTGSSSPSYTLTGLSANTQYCFAVTMWDQAGQSPQSNSVTFTTAYAVPGTPTGLTYVSASRTNVTMSWTQGSGTVIDDYLAYTLSAGCGSGLTVVDTGGAATTYTVAGLVTATTYYWEVAAKSTGGTSSYGSCVTGATQGATPPAPYNLTVAYSGPTWLYLTWINPAGYEITNDVVYVSTANGACGSWSQVDSIGHVATDYNVTGLTAGDSYCLQVSAIDAPSPGSAPLVWTAGGSAGGGQTGPFIGGVNMAESRRRGEES
jgi:hypothetical protein